jgi:di/tricarboxylate transporter
MSPQAIYVIVLVVISMVLLITERVRADLMALIILVLLWAGQVITPVQAVSGFSRPAVITIIGLFIITAALDKTGVTQSISDRMVRWGAGSEARLVFVCLVGSAMLSLIMNTIAAGAMVLPAAVRAARQTGVPTSKLLIPVSFGSLLGGMATFFTTANIVVSTTFQDAGLQPFGLLDFTPTGGVVMLAGIAYMLLIGRRLLPVREAPRTSTQNKRTDLALLKTFYRLNERLWEAEVLPTSPLVGKTLGESEIGAKFGLSVITLQREGAAVKLPTGEEVLQAGDRLLIAGRENRVTPLTESGLKVAPNGSDALTQPGVALIEALVAPHSNLEGRTLKDLDFRKKYGMTAAALWREGRSWRTDVGLFELKVGDSLLLVGPPERVPALKATSDFLILEGDYKPAPSDPRRKWLAILITALVIVVGMFVTPANFPVTVLCGAVLMVVTGCLTMDESYRAIEWKIVFLVAGMLPVSTAMVNTGLAQSLGQGIIGLFGPYGPLAVIGGIYVLTVLLGQVMSGQVVGVVLTPIAISTAQLMGFSPQAAGIAVAIGCSTSFLTPIAHTVNMLMVAPGGYKFSDFFRVGWPLVLVCLVALLIALPIFWPLG